MAMDVVGTVVDVDMEVTGVEVDVEVSIFKSLLACILIA